MAAVQRVCHKVCRWCQRRKLGLVVALLVGAVVFRAGWPAAPATPPCLINPPSPLVDEQVTPQRGAPNIFFIESSCAVKNESWQGLRPRQACAVESAVRHHPGWQVIVLHTCAAPRSGLRMPAGATAVHAPVTQFLRGSPVHQIVERGALAASRWPVQIASDLMRFVALWKYGGVYLDLDFVVLRQLSELGDNWAGAQDSSIVAVGAISVSARPGSAGLQVIEACLASLRDGFDGENWGAADSVLLTHILAQRCNADNPAAIEDCRGFRVLPPRFLYPVHWSLAWMYFQEEVGNRARAMLRKAYAAHLWNNKTRTISKTPRHSAYGSIARANCPDAYESARHGF